MKIHWKRNPLGELGFLQVNCPETGTHGQYLCRVATKEDPTMFLRVIARSVSNTRKLQSGWNGSARDLTVRYNLTICLQHNCNILFVTLRNYSRLVELIRKSPKWKFLKRKPASIFRSITFLQSYIISERNEPKTWHLGCLSIQISNKGGASQPFQKGLPSTPDPYFHQVIA